MSNNYYQDPFSTDQKPPADENLPVAADKRDDYEEPDENEVPKGSAKEVLVWVGDDKDRAQRALDVELNKVDNGRKGLKKDLQDLLAK